MARNGEGRPARISEPVWVISETLPCIGSGARTTMASQALGRADWLLVAASGLALAGFAVARAAGWAADWFAYPTLTLPTIHPWPIAACLLLFAPVLVWRSRR